MSIQDPKTKGKHEPTGHTTGKENKGQQPEPTQEQKKAFDQGLQNNSNTQTGTANSGYDEKNPKRSGGSLQINPKVTNEDNDITNGQKSKQWDDEEPVNEQSQGNSTERTDPEIDSPVPGTEKTEKKIPNMKA